MTKYAANTTVSTESSRGEIERTLQRYGADQFMYGWSGSMAVIEFAASDRRIRFTLTLPGRGDDEFMFHSRGQRTNEAALKAWEQACRQKWRALALCIKAKLEAVESEISTFEDEFLAHTVLPDGRTAGEWMQPQITEVYKTGKMPTMLPALGTGE